MSEHPSSYFSPERKAALKAAPADAVHWGDIIQDLLIAGDPAEKDAHVWEYALRNAPPEAAAYARAALARTQHLRPRLEQGRQLLSAFLGYRLALAQRLFRLLSQLTGAEVGPDRYPAALFDFFASEYHWSPETIGQLSAERVLALLRAALRRRGIEESEGELPKMRRGRPKDPAVRERDKQVVKDWRAKKYLTYAALAQAHSIDASYAGRIVRAAHSRKKSRQKHSG